MTTSLAGYPSCNEQLSVGEPVEKYLFHQFLRLRQVKTTKPLPVRMPLNVAYPALVQVAKVQFGGSAETVLGGIRKPLAPFIPEWSEVTVADPAPAVEVTIPNVAATLLKGTVTHGGVEYDISGLTAVQDALRRREPVVATVRSGAVVTVLKLVPLAETTCSVPERIKMPSAQIREMLVTGRASLPGVGAVDVDIDEEKGEGLIRDGFVTLTATIGGQERPVLVETENEAEPMVPRLTRAPPMGRYEVGPRETTGSYDWLQPEFVIYVPITQTWTSEGYERGALINTFSLAPQEEMTVEVFSWDRRRSESETATGRETEASAEQSFSSKLTSEVVDKATNTNGWKFGFDAGIQVPSTPLDVGVDFSIDQRNETSQTNTLGSIAEGVAKSASRIKSSVQTKVTEAREYGSEERITRRFQNPNVGRVLHFDCFEVLHKHTVTTQYDFTRARLCVLLPGFDLLQGLDSADVLGRASQLLGLEAFLYDMVPERLRGGFDSARLMLAWDRICQFACDAKCDCTPPDASTPAPGAAAAGNPYRADLDAAKLALQKSIQALRGATGQKLARVVGIPADPPGYLDRGPEDQLVRRQDWFGYLFRSIVLEECLIGFWSACIAFDSDPSDTNLQVVADRLLPSITNMLNPGFAFGSIGMAVIRHLLDSVTDFGLNLPFMLAYLGFEDFNLQSTATRALALLGQWKQVEDEKKKPPAPAEDAGGEGEEEPERRTEDPAFAPEALAAASVSIDALVSYLQLNRSAFRAQLWNMLSPEDRQRYVDLHDGVSAFVRPNILGFVDDMIAVEADDLQVAAFGEWRQSVLTRWKVSPYEVSGVSLPVPGMTMQTRVEPCEALEPYLIESRAIELARLRVTLAQLELENKRRGSRLGKGDYDDPGPATPPIRIETVKASE